MRVLVLIAFIATLIIHGCSSAKVEEADFISANENDLGGNINNDEFENINETNGVDNASNNLLQENEENFNEVSNNLNDQQSDFEQFNGDFNEGTNEFALSNNLLTENTNFQMNNNNWAQDGLQSQSQAQGAQDFFTNSESQNGFDQSNPFAIEETQVAEYSQELQSSEEVFSNDQIVASEFVNTSAVNAAAEVAETMNAVPIETEPAMAEVLTIDSYLNWIGYVFDEVNRKITLEIKLSGPLNFEMAQEINAIGQNELVINFKNTTVKNYMLKKDIDASEFASPVSFVRVAQEADVTKVTITLREVIKPILTEDGSHLKLEFAISEKYYAPIAIAQNSVALAEPIATVANIIPLRSENDASHVSQIENVQAPVIESNVTNATQLQVSPEANGQYIENSTGFEGIDEQFDGGDQGEIIEQEEDIGFDGAILLKKYFHLTVGQDNFENQFDEYEETQIINESEFQQDANSNLSQNSGAVSNFNSNTQSGNANLNVQNNAFTNNNTFIDNEEPSQYSNYVDVSNEYSNNIPVNNTNAFTNSNSFGANQAVVNVESNQNINAPLNNSNSVFSQSSTYGNEVPLENAVGLDGVEVSSNVNQALSKDAITGKILNLTFRGAPLAEALRVIMAETGINFTMPPEIGSRAIYLDIKNVAWVDALKAILQTYDLGFVDVAPSLVRIDTLQKLKLEKDMLEDIRKKTIKLTDTTILAVRLSYARAADIAKRIDEMLIGDKKFDDRITVSADVRTNSVYIEATPQVVSKIHSIVQRLDAKTPQVKLESRIVEIIKNASNFLGVNWDTPVLLDAGRGLGFGSLPFPNSFMSSYAVDTGAATLDRPGGRFRFLLGSINNSMELDLRLQLEETKGTTEILESTFNIVQDNEEASIKAGTTDYFRVATTGADGAGVAEGSGISPIQYYLTLTVTPNVTSDGHVAMKLRVTSINPKPSQVSGADASSTDREVTTSLIRASGQTAAIGGLYTTIKSDKMTGVPFFSSIPIIGALFRSSEKTESRRELVILITPTIVNANQAYNKTSLNYANSNLGQNNSNLNYGTQNNATLSNSQYVSQNSFNTQVVGSNNQNSFNMNSNANNLNSFGENGQISDVNNSLNQNLGNQFENSNIGNNLNAEGEQALNNGSVLNNGQTIENQGANLNGEYSENDQSLNDEQIMSQDFEEDIEESEQGVQGDQSQQYEVEEEFTE